MIFSKIRASREGLMIVHFFASLGADMTGGAAASDTIDLQGTAVIINKTKHSPLGSLCSNSILALLPSTKFEFFLSVWKSGSGQRYSGSHEI